MSRIYTNLIFQLKHHFFQIFAMRKYGPCITKINKNKVAKIKKGKTKMTQFIREVVARLSGKAIVYAKGSSRNFVVGEEGL
jgi:hypothetical protein